MRYSVKAKGAPAEVMREAVEFFGPNGIGLSIQENVPGTVTLTAPDGFVTVQLANSRPAELEITTQEYDYDVQRFIKRIS